MPEIEICSLGLRDDRETAIFAEGFWKGVNSTEHLRKQMIEAETAWVIERNRNDERAHQVTATDERRHGIRRANNV